jgi:hypothetical protein
VNVINTTTASLPTLALRTDVQTFSGSLNSFGYPGIYTPSYRWTVYEIFSNNLSTIRQVDLSGNPSAATANLMLLANTLTYGLFRISFQATLSMSTPVVTASSSSADTFVRVSPTGLSVSSLPSGLSATVIGRSQAVTLNPGAYSLDLDSLADMTKLSYTFLCMKVHRNNTQLNYTSMGGVVDLASGKQNSVLSNSSCFNSTGQILKLFLHKILLKIIICRYVKQSKKMSFLDKDNDMTCLCQCQCPSIFKLLKILTVCERKIIVNVYF